MSSKQDRTYTRTPSDIERKYDLSKLNSVGTGGASSAELNQIRQTIAQYVANTNGKITNLQEQIDAIESGGGSGASSAVVLADQTTGNAYKLYMADGKLMFAPTEVTPIQPSQDATLTDDTTGKKYKLYVTNGKLMLAESEE